MESAHSSQSPPRLGGVELSFLQGRCTERDLNPAR